MSSTPEEDYENAKTFCENYGIPFQPMTTTERAEKIANDKCEHSRFMNICIPCITSHLDEAVAIAWDQGCVKGQEVGFARGKEQGYAVAREQAACICDQLAKGEVTKFLGFDQVSERIRAMTPGGK